MKIISVSVSILLLLNISSCGQKNNSENRINWSDFLGRHDLHWEKTPHTFGEGAFLGNGSIGSMIWAAKGEVLHWDLGRSDVYDMVGRVPIGKFIMKTTGTKKSFSMNSSMWNAEVKGRIETDKGVVEWRSMIPKGENVSLVEYTVTGNEQVDFEFANTDAFHANKVLKALRAKFTSEKVIDFSNPDYVVYMKELKENKKNFHNPDPVRGESDGINWLIQPFTGGGGYCLAWVVKKQSSNKGLLSYTIDYFKNAEPNARNAVVQVRTSIANEYNKLSKTHYSWWHNYYPESYLSIPDKNIEGFYWQQIYKIASATSKDGAPIDLMGPWYRATTWNKMWVNLNVQLTYWIMNQANKQYLMEPYLAMINNNLENLKNCAKKITKRDDGYATARAIDLNAKSNFNWEYGNFTWMMHDYWLYCQYKGDNKLLTEKFFPILKGAANFMIAVLKEGKDGKLHFPKDISPEYKIPGESSLVNAEDTNYNIALLMWALKTLNYINDTYNLNDSDKTKWRNISAKLVSLQIDETGLKIATDVPFVYSHRHFSHLMSIFPLNIIDVDKAEEFQLARKSFDRWANVQSGWALYSYTTASSISSRLRDGQAAWQYLKDALEKEKRLMPNTFYVESGPVIESPLAFASAVVDMLLQSWSMNLAKPCLQIFPAIPKDWKDVEFRNLRAQGAFLVSAAKKDGQLTHVKIESLAGTPCTLKANFKNGYKIIGNKDYIISKKKNESGITVFDIQLAKGETLTLVSTTN